MINLNTNWLAIVGAAVASMVLGFVWYSKILFGNEYVELSGLKKGDIDNSKKGMAKNYFISTIASFITAFVLKQFIDLFYIVNFVDAIQLAFWIWFGFVATVMVTAVLFMKQSWKLFIINAGYQLASLIAMALVLSYWQ